MINSRFWRNTLLTATLRKRRPPRWTRTVTPLLQSTLQNFKAAAARSIKLVGVQDRFLMERRITGGILISRKPQFTTAIKRRPSKPRRWILKPLLRSTRQNEKAAADRSTILDEEISTLLSELCALTKRQLQLDTMRADEGTISPQAKSTLTRASRKCTMALDTLRNFIGPAACFIRGLLQTQAAQDLPSSMLDVIESNFSNIWAELLVQRSEARHQKDNAGQQIQQCTALRLFGTRRVTHPLLTFLSITCTGLLSSCRAQSCVDCLHQGSCKLAHRNELANTGLLQS